MPVCCISTLVRACRDHLKPGDYDHYTEAAENRVPPGSQTTRNVCLLARYGSDYKTAGASYPEMPSNRSHAVLARKREDCHHFYGGDEGGECASTESSALKPGRKFQNFFASGDKCKPKDCSYQGGKARCWKRVFCYMEPEAEAAPFVEAGGAPAGQCGKISAADLNWLWVTLGILLGTIFVCGCAALIAMNVLGLSSAAGCCCGAREALRRSLHLSSFGEPPHSQAQAQHTQPHHHHRYPDSQQGVEMSGNPLDWQQQPPHQPQAVVAVAAHGHAPEVAEAYYAPHPSAPIVIAPVVLPAAPVVVPGRSAAANAAVAAGQSEEEKELQRALARSLVEN